MEPGEKFGAGGAGYIRINFATGRNLLDRIVEGIRTGIDLLATETPLKSTTSGRS